VQQALQALREMSSSLAGCAAPGEATAKLQEAAASLEQLAADMGGADGGAPPWDTAGSCPVGEQCREQQDYSPGQQQQQQQQQGGHAGQQAPAAETPGLPWLLLASHTLALILGGRLLGKGGAYAKKPAAAAAAGAAAHAAATEPGAIAEAAAAAAAAPAAAQTAAAQTAAAPPAAGEAEADASAVVGPPASAKGSTRRPVAPSAGSAAAEAAGAGGPAQPAAEPAGPAAAAAGAAAEQAAAQEASSSLSPSGGGEQGRRLAEPSGSSAGDASSSQQGSRPLVAAAADEAAERSEGGGSSWGEEEERAQAPGELQRAVAVLAQAPAADGAVVVLGQAQAPGAGRRAPGDVLIRYKGLEFTAHEATLLQLAPAVQALGRGVEVLGRGVEVLGRTAAAAEALSGQMQQALGLGGRWMARAEARERAARCSRCAWFGLALMAATSAVCSLRVGRLWEVHAACWGAPGAAPPGTGFSWLSWVGLGRGAPLWQLLGALELCGCYVRQLGMFGLAWVVLLRLVAPLVLRGGEQGTGVLLVDVVLLQMLLQGAAGCAVAHCLGASWLAWLLLWEAWCALQLLLHQAPLPRWQQHLLEALLALALPVAAGWLPYHPAVVHWGAGALPVWLLA
jgi:hypothetical protein